MVTNEKIRQYVLISIIEPARRRGLKTVELVCGDIHNRMGLTDRHPQVCSAIDADVFLSYAGVDLIKRSGPDQSSTATWLFRI